jgi:peptide chain release factor subunit 1
MTYTRELRDLRAFPPAYPFVSVYLDVGHNEQSAEAMRVFVRGHLRQARTEARSARDRNHLDADGRHVLAYLEDVIHARVERNSRGLALFSCARQKVFQAVGSTASFQSKFIVSDRPYLEPLETEIITSQNVLACLVDSRSARILELGADGAQPHTEIESNVHQRHHQGGWSQMRFQRHVDDQIDHHHREVAAALVHISDRQPRSPVVIAGPESVVTSFRAHLPDRVQQRIALGLPVSLKTREREIFTRILDGFEREGTTHHERMLEEQVHHALSPALGARGTVEVLNAANSHAIRRLYVASDFEARGWRCRSCGSLGSHVPLTCPFCAGNVEGTDVRPELISKVLASGGEIAALPSDLNLQQGVVALLRHPSLSGRSPRRS